MNRIDFILSLEEKTSKKIEEFKAKYGIAPEFVKIGWALNNSLFKDNDKLCGLLVKVDDNEASTFEVGISV